ncbi:hypothetical protein RvY_01631 [Ramazzottius varieornatus]|uniref:Protein quiver n=1 Tax=Ramazzottius varieornatus TaxID=947166 RepID=A0A1D1URP2_RAMVA|nr:hypothetical protein RvY_01631 [Ramazzottius varieornatus]
MDLLQVFFAVFCIAASSFKGTAAIKCYVCAPVPEIGETCANAQDAILDDCGSTTDSCHVLFIQQLNGATDITRNCGKFRGAFQASDNECKDFLLANHRNAKLCNCKADGCNTQSINPQDVMAQPITTMPSTGQMITASGSDKLPVYNPTTVGGATARASAASTFQSTSSCYFLSSLVITSAFSLYRLF